MKRNELKVKVLRVLERGELTAMGVKGALIEKGSEVKIGAVRMSLLRYYRWGLVVRRPVQAHIGTKEFVYTISNRGKWRLNWLVMRSPELER